MAWIWIGIAGVVAALGLWHRARIPVGGTGGTPRVDDEALRRILEEGTLSVAGDEEPLDMDEAARAEEEFFDESWDEPEEYHP